MLCRLSYRSCHDWILSGVGMWSRRGEKGWHVGKRGEGNTERMRPDTTGQQGTFDKGRLELRAFDIGESWDKGRLDYVLSILEQWRI